MTKLSIIDTQRTSPEQILAMGIELIRKVAKLKIEGFGVVCQFTHDYRSQHLSGKSVSFDITFYCDDDNASLHIYEFWTLEENKKIISDSLAAIQGKDFIEFKKIAKRH